ncbi:MAG: glutamate racemase [Pseudomonadota bacterium]
METEPPLHLPPGQRVLVFDSGIGGITILSALRAQAPGLNVGYAADTGFFPYGDKSDTALEARVPTVAAALVKAARPDLFVIACNTASTLALDAVRARLDIPVVGTVPAIKPAVAASETGTIGLLATPGTLRRAYTARLLSEFARDVHVVSYGSVELVRLAERLVAGDKVSAGEVEAAQAPLFDQAGAHQIDTVVLACTHFPLLRDLLEQTSPQPVRYIDSGEAIARQTLRILSALDAQDDTLGPVGAWVTSDTASEPLLPAALQRYGFETLSEVTVPAAS